jgi:hypothetical protein
MRFKFLLALLAIPVAGFAAAGVDVNVSTADTAMKIIYSGGSPNTAHPAAVVRGKRIGVHGAGNNTSWARGLVGVVGSYTDMGGSTQIGVYGGGNIGVYGYANAYDPAVKGSGYYTGVHGVGYNGVEGFTNSDGYAVYGYADNPYAKAGYFQGDVFVDGDLDWSSDAGLKQNGRGLDKGLATVLALAPKAYEMKAGVTREKPSPGTKYGLIAQEVQVVLPSIVKKVKTPAKRKADGTVEPSAPRTEIQSVNYMALVPVLIKAMQEQQEQIESLKRQVATLQAR